MMIATVMDTPPVFTPYPSDVSVIMEHQRTTQKNVRPLWPLPSTERRIKKARKTKW